MILLYTGRKTVATEVTEVTEKTFTGRKRVATEVTEVIEKT
jgi:hypothetical protein